MQKILAKLHAVMMDVQYIQKDSRNDAQKYNYASEYTIKSALSKAFRDHKIIFQLNTKAPTISEQLGTDYKGNPIKATILECEYIFYDVESGEYLEGEFVASGPARDDKGLWAATTNAIKYILTSTFLIPTGDDAESDINHPPDDEPGEKKQGKKSSKKSSKKTTSAKNKPKEYEDVDYRPAFIKAMQDRCAEQNLTPPTDPDVKLAVFRELCNCSLVESVCESTGYAKPTVDVVMPPNHTGWQALVVVVKEFDIELAK